MTLTGQRVVILGGTAGIGLAAASAAADAGAHVVVASSTPARVKEALAALPAGSEGHQVNLTSEDEISALFDRIGEFDHLVYTAGDPLMLGELPALDLAAARSALDVRFWGALAAAKHARPHLRPGGSITLTTGAAGQRPKAGWTVAASVCGAIEALTRALAVELAPIRVNAVCAGMVRTSLWAPVAGADADELHKTAGGALPVGRIGEPADIAATYLYLMSEGFSTGSVVLVDGGHLVS
jgi:NAD(P)-dependent dehydrogenase (short-subunit alcohol dehydrogenase family)